MKTITVDQLKSHNAGEEQVSLFRETFGKSVTISAEFAEKYAQEFNFDWIAVKLLPISTYADYRKIRDAARADYIRIRGAAWADYRKIRDASWADYRKIRGAAWADYCKIDDAALKDYDKICAATFARFYLSLEE